MKAKILCIEDDPTFQALIAASLKDFDVLCVPDLKSAKAQIAQNSFSVILIDIELPDGDGLRFLAELKSDLSQGPAPCVFFLSGHSQISNKVMAFSFGAEDFITKPFDPIELHARISAKVRRLKSEEDSQQKRLLGDLLLDFSRQKAYLVRNAQETDLQLTSLELKILTLLTKRMEHVYSRDQILEQVWGDTHISDRTVDSHIAHLRQKISKTDVAVETSKSFGYLARLKSRV